MSNRASAASAANSNVISVSSARSVTAKRRREARTFVSSELARIQKDERSIHMAASDTARRGLFSYERAYEICRMLVVEMDRFPPGNGGAA